ncbi:hypothetical protein ACHHYP_12652 [Achlya hypogyna]|uniref:Transmembrane protein n=1 Tax=Achlya hypogyna TaxID=1202772 RepID=A0A1V9ZGU1_ACHHY|nr:hypothetical protein ACHHYP_12652 [Achlya hypogyna]
MFVTKVDHEVTSIKHEIVATKECIVVLEEKVNEEEEEVILTTDAVMYGDMPLTHWFELYHEDNKRREDILRDTSDKFARQSKGIQDMMFEARKSLDDNTSAVEEVQRALLEKADRVKVDLIIESKYEEIIEQLQKAMSAINEDEDEFKRNCRDLQDLVQNLSASKADKKDLLEVKEQVLCGWYLRLHKVENLRAFIDLKMNKEDVFSALKTKADREEMQLLLKSLSDSMYTAVTKAGTLGQEPEAALLTKHSIHKRSAWKKSGVWRAMPCLQRLKLPHLEGDSKAGLRDTKNPPSFYPNNLSRVLTTTAISWAWTGMCIKAMSNENQHECPASPNLLKINGMPTRVRPALDGSFMRPPEVFTRNGPTEMAHPTMTSVEPIDAAPRVAYMGQGMILSVMYLGFSTIVAVATYYLNDIANTPVFFGVVMEAFTYNQWDVPVNMLLQGDGLVFTNYSGAPVDGTVSASDLLYKKCGVNDQGCAAAFLGNSNQIWSAVGKAFSLIPNFDQPLFQDPKQTIKFKHINNLSGWNKAVVQFYIDGHDMAITCMIRRTNFYLTQAASTSAVVDSLAYCSQRTFDPKWMCENEVDVSVNTYAIQVNKGVATYIGVCKRGDIYLNAGHTAVVTGGLSGSYFVSTVPAIDEYQGGIVQASAPWDVLGVSQCYTYDFNTNLGWLLQIQGVVTMTWQCDSLMVTNSIVLWVITVYLVVLQLVFLRQSAICCGPVYMSKNAVGLFILLVAFWGNENLQSLTTFLNQNPVANFDAQFYALCGPAQVASIVGIMTGTVIQYWFTPRIATPTWLISLFSIFNWALVFVLEAFVFPTINDNLPSSCRLPTSTSCFRFSVMEYTYYLSAVASGTVVLVAIATVSLFERHIPDDVEIPPSHSLLRYLSIPHLRRLATSSRGCCFRSNEGPIVDDGLLIMKNMLRISEKYMTRMSNVQYELIYRYLPRWAKPVFSRHVGTFLVFHLKDGQINREFSYRFLHQMGINDSSDRNWRAGFIT